MIGRVQDCGCIALPESLQLRIGLYLGATYEIDVSPDGKALLLRPLETRQPTDLKPGTQCG